MNEANARRERYAAMESGDAPDIPSALSESEWRSGVKNVGDGYLLLEHRRDSQTGDKSEALRTFNTLVPGMNGLDYEDANDLAALIAFANAALPDEDPRKLTREHVVVLRHRAKTVDPLHDLADAIESYLPPDLPPETPYATERQA